MYQYIPLNGSSNNFKPISNPNTSHPKCVQKNKITNGFGSIFPKIMFQTHKVQLQSHSHSCLFNVMPSQGQIQISKQTRVSSTSSSSAWPTSLDLDRATSRHQSWRLWHSKGWGLYGNILCSKRTHISIEILKQ